MKLKDIARRGQPSQSTPAETVGETAAGAADAQIAGISTRQRALGFLRNLGAVHRRVGMAGIAELIAARALPWASYQRIAIMESASWPGQLHPELEPRRVRWPDPEVERFFSRLAASNEPEVAPFTVDSLTQRLSAGYELWVFRMGGQIAHAKWVVRDRLRFGGLAFPLRPEERVLEAAVTLPEFRRRGLNRRAREHLAAVLTEEGVIRALGAINGFNQRLLATTSRLPGTRQVATVQVVSFGARRWMRAVPASSADAPLLQGRGLPAGRWLRQRRASSQTPADRWNQAVERMSRRPYLDPRMAQAKRQAHLDLLERWLPELDGLSVLKTDLWEEAVGGDELLFWLARKAASAHGIDISPQAVAAAERAAARNGVAIRAQAADIRELPFSDGEIDVIVSTSTLDHLAEPDRPRALVELRRVLAPGGLMAITIDNRRNLGDPLLRALARLEVLPFPLGSSLSLPQLQDLVRKAGFVPEDHAYLVHGPRVLTTSCVRAMRRLPATWSDHHVDRLLGGLDAVGRRAPARMGAFAAVLARPADGAAWTE